MLLDQFPMDLFTSDAADGVGRAARECGESHDAVVGGGADVDDKLNAFVGPAVHLHGHNEECLQAAAVTASVAFAQAVFDALDPEPDAVCGDHAHQHESEVCPKAAEMSAASGAFGAIVHGSIAPERHDAKEETKT